jgi:hypothetical protein
LVDESSRGRDSASAFDFILSAHADHTRFEGLAGFLTSKLVVLEKCMPMSAGQEINMLAFDHRAVPLVTNAVTHRSSVENRRYCDDLQIDRGSRSFAAARGAGNGWQ